MEIRNRNAKTTAEELLKFLSVRNIDVERSIVSIEVVHLYFTVHLAKNNDWKCFVAMREFFDRKANAVLLKIYIEKYCFLYPFVTKKSKNYINLVSFYLHIRPDQFSDVCLIEKINTDTVQKFLKASEIDTSQNDDDLLFVYGQWLYLISDKYPIQSITSLSVNRGRLSFGITTTGKNVSDLLFFLLDFFENYLPGLRRLNKLTIDGTVYDMKYSKNYTIVKKHIKNLELQII